MGSYSTNGYLVSLLPEPYCAFSWYSLLPFPDYYPLLSRSHLTPQFWFLILVSSVSLILRYPNSPNKRCTTSKCINIFMGPHFQYHKILVPKLLASFPMVSCMLEIPMASKARLFPNLDLFHIQTVCKLLVLLSVIVHKLYSSCESLHWCVLWFCDHHKVSRVTLSRMSKVNVSCLGQPFSTRKHISTAHLWWSQLD